MTILMSIILFVLGAIFVPRFIPEMRTTRGGQLIALGWLPRDLENLRSSYQ